MQKIKKNFWDTFNNFILSDDVERMQKILIRYDLFKKTNSIPGDIVECGVFKGTGIMMWAKFLKIYDPNSIKKIVGFDTFGNFSKSILNYEKKEADKFIKESSFTKANFNTIKKIASDIIGNDKIELIKGDIIKTSKKYMKKNKGFRISLLHLDLDTFAGTYAALKNFYPALVKGAIIILDEYGVRGWGESDAVDIFFKKKNIKILKVPYSTKPTSFIIKNE